MRIIAAAVLLLACGRGAAQDPDGKLAERLKAIVDLRLDQLRAELHREIDAAMKPLPALGLTMTPPSEEFRELHRLPEGCGLRVEAIDPAGAGWLRLGLRRADVVLSVGCSGKTSRWIKSSDDVSAVLLEARARSDIAVAVVIRQGERVSAVSPDVYRSPAGLFAPFALNGPEVKPAETADEMLDRLWKKAVQEQAPSSLEPVPEKEPVPESHPTKNSPIPGKGGRR